MVKPMTLLKLVRHLLVSKYGDAQVQDKGSVVGNLKKVQKNGMKVMSLLALRRQNLPR